MKWICGKCCAEMFEKTEASGNYICPKGHFDEGEGVKEKLQSLANQLYAGVELYRPNIYNKETKQYEPNPKPRPDHSDLYARGLLRVDQLEHGKYYLGACRNADVARWNANTKLFYYVRTKFGNSFEEEIPHPEHDEGYDVFAAVAEVEPTEYQKVSGGFESE